MRAFFRNAGSQRGAALRKDTTFVIANSIVITFTLYEFASLYTPDLTAEPGICGLASQTKIARLTSHPIGYQPLYSETTLLTQRARREGGRKISCCLGKETTLVTADGSITFRRGPLGVSRHLGLLYFQLFASSKDQTHDTI